MKEYIEKQKILNFCKSVVNKEFVGAFNAFAVYVNTLPTVEAPTWIPCSEGLPNEMGTVIVTLLDEYGEYDVEEEWWTGDMFLNFGESSSGYKVLAWMPIPEPYKQDVGGVEHG